MDRSGIPNLFIIGAMKAGTSSLHEYLHQHPQIFMSRFKEPQFFAPHKTRLGIRWGQGNPFPETGMDWYLDLFADAREALYRGESSVSYTARPWMEGCAKRIYEFNPQARFIYLLRDPIDRAISHYWHFVADGREDLGLVPAFRRRVDYVARSNYAMQLEPYLEYFGQDKVYLLTLEELVADPAGVFDDLFRWLGVDRDVSIDIAKQHNVGEEEIRQTRRGMVPFDSLQKHWRFGRWVNRVPSAKRVLERLTYRDVLRNATELSDAVSYLRPVLQPMSETLFQIAGRQFAEWKTTFPENENYFNGSMTQPNECISLRD